MRFRILGPRTDVATAEQVRAAREARGWTVEQMADAVGTSSVEVSAWEAGAVPVPPLQAALVLWMLATDRWNVAAAEMRIEPCGWVRQNEPHLYEMMLADGDGYWGSLEIQDHLIGCPTCDKAISRALRRLGPAPVEPDVTTFYTLRARCERWVQRLPRWARGPFSRLGGFWAQTIVMLVPYAAPHLLPGTRVPGTDEAPPPPRADPVPDHRRSR